MNTLGTETGKYRRENRRVMEEETLTHFLKRQKTKERNHFDFWNIGGLENILSYFLFVIELEKV